MHLERSGLRGVELAVELSLHQENLVAIRR
jgi:hypothetical protein